MEECRRMKVEEISRENIKPTTPTPSHLATLTLSLYDQITPPAPTPTLLFYPVHKTLDIVAHLKASLSQTLDSFYPLAGRYETWNSINCNDEGIPFLVTRVSCPLSTLLNLKIKDIADITNTKIALLTKLYPPTDLILIGNGVIVAIQVNVFTCGGFVLGLFHCHKPLDGTSFATFLMHWAARAAQRQPLQPDFWAALTSSPPYPPEKDPELRPKMACLDRRSEAINQELLQKKGDGVIVRSFVFRGEAVSELKTMAASKQIPNPSRFLALSAFIWKKLMHITTSSTSITHDRSHFTLGLAVDVRSKTNPPLPKVAIGNIVEMVAVDLGDHQHGDRVLGLPELVLEINASIGTTEHKVAEYKCESRGEAKIKNFFQYAGTISKYGLDNLYIILSWCKSAGFSEVDFGVGKPKWIIPTHERLCGLRKNSVYLLDYVDPDSDDPGFEVWFFLEENKMKLLESDQDFLTFASPCF